LTLKEPSTLAYILYPIKTAAMRNPAAVSFSRNKTPKTEKEFVLSFGNPITGIFDLSEIRRPPPIIQSLLFL